MELQASTRAVILSHDPQNATPLHQKGTNISNESGSICGRDRQDRFGGKDSSGAFPFWQQKAGFRR